MGNPAISVIVPAYNGEDHFRLPALPAAHPDGFGF
jgi:hypothetical protein